MMAGMAQEIGETRDVGFEIGVSRTVRFPRRVVWDFLAGPRGSAVWLGPGAVLGTQRGSRYRTADGTTGGVRSFRELDRIRLTWRPAGWDHDTTVQVTVSGPATGATVLRFHQERLADGAERERQRAHWKAVMDRVVAALGES
jgi:uncharacterized protein YndB with AHSA1/START domain